MDAGGPHGVAPARVRPLVELHVAAEAGRREVAVELLRVLADGQLVVVRSRIRDRVGHGHRDVLAEPVGRVGPTPGSLSTNLREPRAVGPVGDAEVVGRRAGVSRGSAADPAASFWAASDAGREADVVRRRVGHDGDEVAREVGGRAVGDRGVDGRGPARGDTGLRPRHLVAAAGGETGGERDRCESARPAPPSALPVCGRPGRPPRGPARPCRRVATGRAQNATIQLRAAWVPTSDRARFRKGRH